MRIKTLILSLIFSNCVFAASLYKWKDANGTVHYTDKPPAQTKSQELKTSNSLPSASTVENISDSPNKTIQKTSINDVDAVPYLVTSFSKQGYKDFLATPKPRFLAVCPDGMLIESHSTSKPKLEDLIALAKRNPDYESHKCEPYAYNDEVIYKK